MCLRLAPPPPPTGVPPSHLMLCFNIFVHQKPELNEVVDVLLIYDGLGGFIGTDKLLEGLAHGCRVHSLLWLGLLLFQEGQEAK